ncbi:MAG: tRNA lysidine(34) synthetase TilS [Flavobacteriales bacterium]|nr:tRNA lysidine(34) synthetase TilS [Flavobacteriales bacterium]
MNSFLQQCKDSITRSGITASSKPLLALSGGVDSSVLFHVLCSLQIPFAAAHVNYRLRGTDSENDEAFCRTLCQNQHIPFHVLHAPAELKNQSSIQEKAREIRYTFFESLIREHHYTHILTAHHADDSVETFFINLVRGAGIQGLKGIPESSGNRVRPLIQCTKAEVLRYAAEHNISYREDVSNQKDQYLRNRIRHHVIPALEKIETGAIHSISESLDKVASESDLLQFFVNQYKDDSLDSVSKEQIFTLPEKLRSVFLFRFFQPYGIRFSQAETLAGLLHTTSGKKVITAGYQIWAERERFIAIPHSAEKEIAIVMDEDEIQIPGYKTEIQSVAGFTINPNPRMAFLDVERLEFPLIWRKWEPGDQMIPLGMKGKKNVSDILIDRKLEMKDKDKVHVLCSGGHIVWLEGLRIADSSKISEHTTRILAIVPENM